MAVAETGTRNLPEANMLLYYYTSQQFGLLSLADKRLKIARFTELNDPFDWIGIATENIRERTVIRKLREKFNGTNGLLCMSTSWQIPLLWAHYADKHKGICLGFKVRDEDWSKVAYTSQRPKYQDYKRQSITALRLSDILDIMKKKGSDWSYEAEYRKFIKLTSPDIRSGLFFEDFSENMRLASIYVGERATVSKDWIRSLVEHNGGNIEFCKVRSAYQSYSIIPSSNNNWR